MDKKKSEYLFLKYPILFFVLPFIGGIFAWYFSQNIELGLFVCIGGLLLNALNWFLLKRKMEHGTK